MENSNKPTKLSFSQIQRYQMCPKSYEYYYVKKIKTPVYKSSLLFGSAIDAGLNVLLTTRNLDKALLEFENKLQFFTNENGEIESAPKNKKIVYAANDWDKALFDTYVNSTEFSNDAPPFEEAKDEWYNYYLWHCLLFRGRILIKTYYEEILPFIEDVIFVQHPIQIKNADNDVVTGFVDAVVIWKNIGTVLIDHKTAFSPYDQDEVANSQQLALYYWILQNHYNIQISKAAYIVLSKKLKKISQKKCKKCGHMLELNSRHKTCNAVLNKKRCGGECEEVVSFEGNIQLLMDDISSTVQEFVLENLDVINYGIKQRFFPANLTACKNFWGGVCEYFDLCYKKRVDK